MSDDANEDIPKFRFVEKKVDTSWKDEVRKEREAASKEAASAPKSSSPDGAGATAGKTANAKPAAAAAGPAKAGEPSRIFLEFLAQIVQQGLMQLGAMESPFTGQREVNLEGAQFTIELLGALQEKTKGNLVDQENRMLTEALRELQLHYVEVAQAVREQMQKQAKDLKDGPKGPKK
jgi:hypothetical protein